MKSRSDPGPNTVLAAAEPTAFRIRAAGSVAIEAAKGEGKRPTFDLVAYTGAVMSIEMFYTPVIVDLAGLRAAGQQIPILFAHDTSRIVGQTDSIKIAGDVRLSGTITGENADAIEVVTQAKNGFKWQASIGATILRREFLEAGKTTSVNGREVTGPLVIAREAQLTETSFVAIGADNQTSADVAASHPPGTHQGASMFEQWLQAKGFDPAALSDAQKTSLRAMFDHEQAAPAPAPTPAPTPSPSPTPAAAAAANPTLESIFADQRREQQRVDEITRITAEAVRERPGMIDTLERMSRSAIEARSTTPQEYELLMLRATRMSAAASPTFGIHPRDSRATARTLEAALCLAGGLEKPEAHFDERTLNAAADRFPTGVGLCDVLMISAREHGYTGHSARDVGGLLRAAFPTAIRAEGFSTLSLPGILSNVANKFLTAGFNAVEDTWRMIAARRPVNDFKAISTYALTGGMQYEKVGPSGELKHATASELTYTNQAETYGRIFAITRRDIINDDLGALTQIPKKLGRGAALSLNDTFWTVFLNNSAFFTSGRGNYSSGAGTALSIAALTTADTLFRNQTDPDGYPVAITPTILLLPNALSVLGANLMNSTFIANDTTANTLSLMNNPFAGKYKPVVSSYLSNSNYTGYSTTAFYLLADPNDLASIEVAFLNGRETPTIESADAEFDVLGIQFRGFYDFGVGVQEYRAGVKLAGA